MFACLPTLVAVHISANVLYGPFLLIGFLGAVALVVLGASRLRDEEIPRVALTTAAFFVASQIHVPIGVSTVHLVLNGLVGLTLGRRACLAIPIGVFLQALLLGHGDLSTLGVNCCVLTLPALLARYLYRLGAVTERWGFGEAMLASLFVLLPWSILVGGPALLCWRRLDRHWNLTAEFRGGFLVGAGTVLITVIVQAIVLITGGDEDWRILAAFSVVGHIPIAIAEGVIVGFATNFLMRVRPELLASVHASRHCLTPAAPVPPTAHPTVPAQR